MTLRIHDRRRARDVARCPRPAGGRHGDRHPAADRTNHSGTSNNRSRLTRAWPDAHAARDRPDHRIGLLRDQHVQREIEVFRRDVEVHAHHVAHGARADDVHAERGMQQCSEAGVRGFAGVGRQRDGQPQRRGGGNGMTLGAPARNGRPATEGGNGTNEGHGADGSRLGCSTRPQLRRDDINVVQNVPPMQNGMRGHITGR